MDRDERDRGFQGLRKECGSGSGRRGEAEGGKNQVPTRARSRGVATEEIRLGPRSQQAANPVSNGRD